MEQQEAELKKTKPRWIDEEKKLLTYKELIRYGHTIYYEATGLELDPLDKWKCKLVTDDFWIKLTKRDIRMEKLNKRKG